MSKKDIHNVALEDCTHCGQPCGEEPVLNDGLAFCCHGCQTVYQILESGEGETGINIPRLEKFEYLDSPEIVEALLTFSTNAQARVGFRLPDIHCSSCIQILEKMHGLHPGIISSRIDFPNKKINILFLPDIIGLREIVELLTYLGYEPEVNLDSLNDRPAIYRDRKLILKLGVAGFIFGNVMLLSFPEYFGLDDPLFERAFGYLSLAFCIPLLTFCASDYLNSAYAAILNKGLNIDVPITIGILALFGRSAYEILTHTGPGYLDSLSGFVFFLLIGRWFQKKTYDRISFDRNYQSYFPLHATRIVDGKCTSLLLKNIRPKDRLLIRSGEIIPCDGVLNSNRARIDYSFVTGEETPVPVSRTNKIYAGGRNAGASIQLEVTEAVDQSYLMKLWEEKAINPNEEERSRITDRIGTYFTVSILMIALATLIYWYLMDAEVAVLAFTSVLIIACPCVIALSIPFTYGSLLSLLSMRSIFLKNTSTIEKLQSVDTFVFDKTGTITSGKKPEVEYIGRVLTWDQKKAITTLTQQSSHPMSRFVEQFLDLEMISDESLEDFQEITGKGLQGNIDGHRYRIGSGTWVKKQDRSVSLKTGEVHVSEDDQYLGCFKIITKYRPDLNLVLAELRKMGKVFLLTGDNAFQSVELKQEFGFKHDEMYFDQSPLDKKQWIENLQKSGHRVMMIGDGLNDSGALLSSDVGIVVTEDLNNFTPASDVVIQSENFRRLPELFSILFSVRKILFFLYLMAILYNAVGLYFAVQGLLSPVVAAILMPTSSISMVVAGYLLTRWSVNRRTRSWGREIFRLQQPRPNYAVS